MLITPYNNSTNNISFGHLFRVSICLKSENGLENKFVNPASNKKLYQTLNSKIVGWLNEDYISWLRRSLGVERKTTVQPSSDIHKNMVKELKEIDTDYASFSCVRTIYNPGKLANIATGVDVAITENLKGLKQIGIAKADSLWYQGKPISDYVKSLSRIVQNNVRDYVQNSSVILRSKNNKEIMLKVIFKEAKNSKGKITYELDSYEFHENVSKPSLPPVSTDVMSYKYHPSMQEEIRKTIKHHADRILKKKTYFQTT